MKNLCVQTESDKKNRFLLKKCLKDHRICGLLEIVRSSFERGYSNVAIRMSSFESYFTINGLHTYWISPELYFLHFVLLSWEQVRESGHKVNSRYITNVIIIFLRIGGSWLEWIENRFFKNVRRRHFGKWSIVRSITNKVTINSFAFFEIFGILEGEWWPFNTGVNNIVMPSRGRISAVNVVLIWMNKRSKLP